MMSIRPGDVLDQAADLLQLSDERDAWHELWQRTWRDGYGEAAREQWAAGYAAAITDIKRAQRQMYDAIQRAGVRLAPGGAAWLAAVERNGGTEYGGAGKPRVPIPPEVIETARQAQKGRTA
jgi:hypothetical protein